MKTVRIGVLGCADIARRRLLPAIAAEPGTTVAAVSSRDGVRARELAGRFGARPVTGYAELLERDDIDAVYLPLPAALHARWTEAALRAGKHVLAEKPLTTSLAQSRRLIDLARESGLALMENIMFVHHSQHDAVRKLVADGAIGDPRAFHAAFTVPRLPDDDIRYSPELGGGTLWDTGVYPLRAALYFLGQNLEVLGALLTEGPGRRVDTAGSALLRTPEGVGVQLTFGLDHGYRSAYEIWGSQGRITVERAFTPPADHRPLVRIERRGGVEEVSLSPDDQVAATVRAFASAVRDRSATDPACLRQAELLHELREQALPSRP
ncbi:Gfo/Idh/MocA family oxidoreductase [Streptomyces laculatispora]|uniref:Gfo/Idh/MocA family oxidoreductase n=1 Tax=Streptomyces laculatispora TaxID=887464 RepID=A0ABY9I1Q3_9ACTN|nr:Gfo/Idh/MocA family oxidoreductase [Streptomyces laculatispora]MBO0913750.1 Gfo/Idh/MocA family oxidoreductase [Streptomyces laculatispora]WLQ40122.1 Gfo/Idh/MocA family oxidoreductase [Streptomyces laculatispora]